MPVCKRSYCASFKRKHSNASGGPVSDGKIVLPPDQADLHGDRISTEDRDGQSNISSWNRADDWASWNVQFVRPGRYTIATTIAAPGGDRELVLDVEGQQLKATAAQTGAWHKFVPLELGQIEIKEPGRRLVKLSAANAAHWRAINVRAITLTPVP